MIFIFFKKMQFTHKQHAIVLDDSSTNTDKNTDDLKIVTDDWFQDLSIDFKDSSDESKTIIIPIGNVNMKPKGKTFKKQKKST